MIVSTPGSSFSKRRDDNSAMPVMMPGRAIGKLNMLLSGEGGGRGGGWRASAARLRRPMAKTEANVAVSKDRKIDSMTSGRSSIRPNHFRVYPGGGKVYALSSMLKE